MNHYADQTPVIISLSSHDPTGSSGIQADIETASSLGCHCTPIITAVCAKDTQSLKDIIATETGFLIEQTRAILEDMPVRAIKIGMMATVENVEAIHAILCDYPDIPVILDPVIAEFSNELFNTPGIIRATQALLLPMTTIATPDSVEAQQFARQADTVDACAHEILETGCDYVMVSGSVRTADNYGNTLYANRRVVKHYDWPRLKMLSHGAGATLSASISSYLAHGIRVEEAVQQAQQFTWEALAASRRLGMGRQIPNRMHWANKASQGQKRNIS
ncbi:MAG: bifunctional hydroxymethylpyrimidine kinase/phosphomethylpyrimidine kinase [Cellvibrionaceae bacterium]